MFCSRRSCYGFKRPDLSGCFLVTVTLDISMALLLSDVGKIPMICYKTMMVIGLGRGRKLKLW